MPVNIYRVTPDNQENEEIAWLCDDEWLLWPQVEALAKWLQERSAGLPQGEYVADIGFCWRRDASAGGPVLEPETLRRLADVGMSLFLSGSPGFAGEEEQDAEPNAALNGGPAASVDNSNAPGGPPSVS
jgi:hypothetical protein